MERWEAPEKNFSLASVNILSMKLEPPRLGCAATATERQRGCSRCTKTDLSAPLTGLRYVAAVTVAVGHGALALRHDWLAQLVAQISSIGMTLFFVLSGFVLWLNYSKSFAFPKPFSKAARIICDRAVRAALSDVCRRGIGHRGPLLKGGLTALCALLCTDDDPGLVPPLSVVKCW